jgi:lipid-binding SYLF domain-containing protein
MRRLRSGDVADSWSPIGECRKTGKILASFVDPRQSFGPDKIIPPNILANAKVREFLCIRRRLLELPKQAHYTGC